jgi:chromosome segregation ATPase
LESLILSIRIERRWPLQALLGVALVWGVAALIVAVQGASPGLAGVLAVALAVLPPAALGLLAWALLPATGQSLALADAETRLTDARAQVAELEAQLTRVDTVLASSLGQTETLAAAARTTLPALGESAALLEGAAGRVAEGGVRTQAIVDGFAAALPALERTIATVDQTLRAVSSDSAVQLRGVEATLATVHERGRAAAAEADAAIAAMTALLTRIDEASSRNTAALSKRAYALDAAVDGVLERTTAAVDHMREAVEGRMAALESGVDQAARQLTLLGDDSARLFNQRLELLLATAQKMQGHFAEQEASSARLQTLVGGHVDAMAGRLAEFDATSHAAADALAGRLDALTDQAGALATPIEATVAVVAKLGEEAEAFGSKVTQVDDVVNERLARFREAMAGLEIEAERLTGNVEVLSGSVSTGSTLVGEAATALAREREAVEAVAATLAGHFEAARAALADLEAGTEAAAARVETGLAADVARVVVAGEAAATGIKAALAAVVDEAVARLGESAGAEAETAFGAPIRAQIEAIEAATLRARDGSSAAAERLTMVAGESSAATEGLTARLAALTAQAEALAPPIEATRAAVAALEGEAEAFGNKVADVDDVVTDRLAQLQAAMAGLEREAARLDGNVEALSANMVEGKALIGEAATALGEERDKVEALAAGLAGHLETARTAVAGVAAETETAAERVESGLATDVARVVVAGDAAVSGIKAALAAVVDEAVARLGESSSAAETLAARLAALTAQAEALAPPIEATRVAVAALEGEAEAFGSKVTQVEEVLNERLSGTRQSMAGLESEAARLFETVAGLGASVQDGSNLVGDAASALAREREEIERLAAELAGHFDAARAALAEIETGSAAAASSVESGLVADVARVVAAGETAAADIRAALTAVVDEAVDKLAEASRGDGIATFSAPVRAQIEAIETATARAADTSHDIAGRLAAQMVRLAATVDTVENRISEVDMRFTMKARDSLANRSTRLINQLNAAAVDVAGLLSISVDNADWTGYLRGDRGVFARAIAARIDRETARQMARLYEHDSSFQAEAVRFCETFEDLITRLLGDGDGDVLATMMLSSDLGKIYLAIADASGRLPPTR